MDADAHQDALVLALAGVVVGEAALRGERAIDGAARAAEDDEERIADSLDLPAAICSNRLARSSCRTRRRAGLRSGRRAMRRPKARPGRS
jgi:hypothetical protein